MPCQPLNSLSTYEIFFVTESAEGTNRLINVFVFLFLNSLFHILNNTSKEAEGAAESRHWMSWDEGRLLWEGKGEDSWKCPLECCSDLFWAKREVFKLVVNDEAPKGCKIRLSNIKKWFKAVEGHRTLCFINEVHCNRNVRGTVISHRRAKIQILMTDSIIFRYNCRRAWFFCGAFPVVPPAMPSQTTPQWS